MPQSLLFSLSFSSEIENLSWTNGSSIIFDKGDTMALYNRSSHYYDKRDMFFPNSSSFSPISLNFELIVAITLG
jgi:hypothetical protein